MPLQQEPEGQSTVPHTERARLPAVGMPGDTEHSCVEVNRLSWSRTWSDCIFELPLRKPDPGAAYRVGVLEGEGVGPDVIACALHVLSALSSVCGRRFQVEFGGAVGRKAEAQRGEALPREVIEFCEDVFSRGGAILSGAAGGRFVYDLRRKFDLFCKLSPVIVPDAPLHAGRIKPDHLRSVDILVVRENASGVYQGRWAESNSPTAGRVAEHSFSYTEAQVRRILTVAARIAKRRGGEMAVVYKAAGVPTVSALWRDCAAAVAATVGVRCSLLDADYAAFRLVQDPGKMDVLVAPNLLGDILSDLGGVLVGSRALTYSGNFAANGAAVYQTNHGAAFDLVGTDQANPVGQILALAMLLRESFGLIRESCIIQAAVEEAWRGGCRTADLAEPGCRVVGTREMGNLIADAAVGIGKRAQTDETSPSAD
jgi:3-isopropylmalate dehydrogenase